MPGSSAELAAGTAAKPDRSPASLSVYLERPVHVRFSLDDRGQRLGGALGISVVSHVATVALVLFIASHLPESVTSRFVPDRRNYDIVWIPMEGPGGGGGGGGNESPDPPRKAEMPGPDAITVPVSKAPDPQKDEPEEEQEAQELDIPAKTLSGDELTLAGVLEALPGPVITSQGSGIGGGAGTGEGTGIGSGRGSGLGMGEGGGSGGGVYRPGSGVTLPRPIREVKPQYTADAMRAKIQGAVWLEAVVMPDGGVGDVRITKSLDPVFGLDDEALRAAKQWRFIPGTRFGEPVPVLVVIELTFTLR